jgi:predicted transcriptional regulator YdeE
MALATHLDIDGLALEALDEKGKPVETRLKDVASALSIYSSLRRGDEKSSVTRARIDAMFDGAAPYDAGKLASSGQQLKTNLNFGDGQRLLDIALSSYVDLYSSLERLVEVKGTVGEKSQIGYKEDVVADEITNMLRNWPEFHSIYLRLCTTFIKHGVAVSYFDSPDEWRFRVGSFADILIPRQSVASENCVDVAVIRREYLLHELFSFVRNENAAEKVGWIPDEVKRVIVKNVKTTGRRYSEGGSLYTDWEAIQQEMKNNDLYTGLQNPTVSVLHFLIREMDGSVSHFICAEDSPKDFLYKKISRYSTPEQAYVMFTYGVGSNGTYHSIRGLGQRIFNHIQTSNRLRCQMIDGAMLSSAVMLQPESQRALDELQFTYYGAYAIVSPNVKIVEKAIPNLSQAVVPALQDLTNQLQLNTDTVSTYGPNQASPYRNQMQVVSDMDVSTRLSGASLNLFYAAWTRLMREVVRRIVENKRPDAAIKEFYRRCEIRGVEPEFIKTLDLSKTKAVRSIGNGSYANRLVALRELQAMSGTFDEVGRRNLTRDIVSTRVGHDLADRYVPANVEERPTVDLKIAYFENQQLQAGQPVPVVPNEMHGMHLQTHLPILSQIIEQINVGQADPQQVLPMIQAFYQHIGETIQFAAGDPSLQSLVSQAKQVMQYAEEAINNTNKALQKMQRDQAASQEQMAAAGQQMPEGTPQMNPIDLKMQEHQMKLDMAKQKAELDMQLRKAKFDQEQAMRDAKEALKFREMAPQTGPE